MSNYNEIVLKQGSTIVAYLAPNFTVEPVIKNNPINFARPRGRGPLTKDLGRVNLEIVVQGTFLDSDELPPDHVAALETLFGVAPGTPITAVDQVNRLWYYAWEGGRFILEDGADTWDAETAVALDIEDGTYPSVIIGEVRRTADAGVTKRTYMIRLIPGFKS
ncbi:MAG: hypothetical protein DRO11_02180 [Methanobacteriota archaeon]|nr:MAG: hypothetical protein DRO11_02180 [Euryarchaeota archaeon]